MTDTKWYPAAHEKGVVGRFEYLDLLDVPASKEADETRTKRIIVLRTKVAASTDDTVSKLKPETQEAMISRFPDAWRAFEGKEPIIHGTPLADMGYPEREILQLQLQGITSAEQLADLSDALAGGLGFGYRKKRDDAKAWLADRKQKALDAAVAKASAPAPVAATPDPYSRMVGESLEDFARRIAAAAGMEESPKNRGGRPPGSKNKPKEQAAA